MNLNPLKKIFVDHRTYYILIIVVLMMISILLSYQVITQNKPIDAVVLVNTKHNFPLLIKTNDGNMHNSFEEHAPYQDHLFDILKDILTPGDICIDIGAGYGYYTILMSKLVQDAGKVYSFNPIPDIYTLLDYSVKMNRATNTKVFGQILYSQNTEVFLETYNNNPLLYSILLASMPNEQDDVEHHLMKMHAYTLDSFIPDLHHVKLMRINTNGSELHILKGAKDIISKSPNISFIISWHAAKFAEYSPYYTKLIDNLVEAEFEFWLMRPGGIMQLVHKDQLLKLEGSDILITKLSVGQQ